MAISVLHVSNTVAITSLKRLRLVWSVAWSKRNVFIHSTFSAFKILDAKAKGPMRKGRSPCTLPILALSETRASYTIFQNLWEWNAVTQQAQMSQVTSLHFFNGQPYQWIFTLGRVLPVQTVLLRVKENSARFILEVLSTWRFVILLRLRRMCTRDSAFVGWRSTAVKICQHAFEHLLNSFSYTSRLVRIVDAAVEKFIVPSFGRGWRYIYHARMCDCVSLRKCSPENTHCTPLTIQLLVIKKNISWTAGALKIIHRIVQNVSNGRLWSTSEQHLRSNAFLHRTLGECECKRPWILHEGKCTALI